MNPHKDEIKKVRQEQIEESGEVTHCLECGDELITDGEIRYERCNRCIYEAIEQ